MTHRYIALLLSGILLTTYFSEEKGRAVEMKESTAKEISREGNITKLELENGLIVLLEENHSAPVTAVNVWVKVGSACEREDEAGLAHVHEHMVFKGTSRHGVGEIARIIEAHGGDINAFTSFDQTVYHIVIASRFLDTALDILSDAMENALFDPQELEKELEVVLEEIRRGEDIPSRQLSERLFSAAYTHHPYRRPIIGYRETVKGFTREKVMDFYKRWYAPNNVVLVVVGDFDTPRIIPRIKETFGVLKSKPLPKCVDEKEPPQDKTRAFVFDKNVQEGYFALAFHIPNLMHEDIPAIDVLSSILGGGESSRLYRQVKEEKGLVTSIYSYAFTPKYPGIFMVGGTLDPEKASQTLSEVIKEAYRLKYEPVDYEELSRAKINIESDSVYAKETAQGQAQRIGYFEVVAGDYRYEGEYLKRVLQVSREDILRIANKYLSQVLVCNP